MGTVKNLRESMKISEDYDDDDIVYKYGRTDNICRRLNEHKRSFIKINNVVGRNNYFSIINNSSLSNAETDLFKYFKTLGINYKYDTFKELIIANSEQYDEIVRYYKDLGQKYGKDMEKINQINEKIMADHAAERNLLLEKIDSLKSQRREDKKRIEDDKKRAGDDRKRAEKEYKLFEELKTVYKESAKKDIALIKQDYEHRIDKLKHELDMSNAKKNK